MTNTTQSRRLITHSEDFHTDDVFATALLLTLFPEAEVMRSRDEQVLATGDIVYDVGKTYDPGRGRYDHHQAEASKRSNGIIYSSFGLLWQDYGVAYCDGDKQVAEIIDKKLVTPIDAIDNGQAISQPIIDDVQPFTIDNIIKQYNPLGWSAGDETPDTQFQQAVQIASQILQRLKQSVSDDVRSQAAVLAAYQSAEDKRIVVIDKPASVADILEQVPELLYLISPRPNNTWGILAVSVARGSFTPRRPFPEAWRAQPADTLPALTGVADTVFCHATGFFAVSKSRQGAIALATTSLATE